VFAHIPPPIFDFETKVTESPEKLLELCEAYRVDYAFFGDYHGYRRTKLNYTNYIVTGGGGAHLIRSFYGRFHHFIVMELGKDYTAEKIAAFDRTPHVADIVEHSILAEINPWIIKHPKIIILRI